MRRILIAAALVVLLLTAGWYEGLYRHETSHIASLETKQQAASLSLLSLETRYASLVSGEKRLPQERVALAELRRLVPNGPDLDNLVTTLFAAAAKAGCQLASIGSPQPSGFGAGAVSATSGPTQVPLSMTVDGTATKIERLYGILEAEPRLFVIDNFVLSFGNGGGSTGSSPTAAGGVANSATIDLRAFYASASAASAAS